MKKKFKIFLIVITIIVIGAAGFVYYLFYQPKPTVDNKDGIAITASQLVKEFQANEQAANAKYVDKVVAVTGAIGTISETPDGKVTVNLSSDDPFVGVFCTLKKEDVSEQVREGSTITIKGFCSGMLSDVRLREAVVVRNS